MNNLLASGLSALICSAEECLTWIIILLNILTIFYLVFCAFFRVTKVAKVIGYVWASALTVGTVAVVAVHTCIFTVLSAVFTALILMAVLSVVLDKGVFATPATESGKQKKPFGAYVVHKTDDGKYAFLVYNDRKLALARSYFKYDLIDEVKNAIAVCRENGLFVSIENKTKNWIEYVNHPKFIMFEEDGKYYFRMTLADGTLVLLSEPFDEADRCEKTMNEAVSAVKSERTYYSENEILAGGRFVSIAKDEVAVIPEKEIAVTEPISDEDEEGETVEDGVVYRIRYNKSFTARLMQSPDEAKRYYSELKNEIMAYAKTKSRVSWSYDSIYVGRVTLVKFAIRGKTLCVYYALNADDYADSKYKVEKSESTKYEDVPCLYRIRNDRRFKYAKKLIADVCEKLNLPKGELPTENYVLPYRTTATLIKKGMIKKVKSRK